MSQFNDKVSFFSGLFDVPEGYQIDFVEATTFSLSLKFLCFLPMMMYAGERRINLTSPADILKSRAFQEYDYSNRFRVFYDGTPKIEPDDSLFYTGKYGEYTQLLYAKRCTPIFLKNRLFHPKIILIQFSRKTHTDSKKRFRAFIGSKNLTFSRYCEAGILLEGIEGEETATQTGKALADFFRDTKVFPRSEASGIWWEALEKTHLTHKEAKEVSIHFGGGKSLLYDKIKSDVGENKKMRITSMKPNTALFGTDKRQYIANFKDLYDENDSGSWSRNESCKHENEDIGWYIGEEKENPKPLHVKQYIIYEEKDRKNDGEIVVWLGSANCSHKGLKENVEVMVRFISTVDSSYFPVQDQPSKGDYAPYDGHRKLKYWHVTPITEVNVSQIEDEEDRLSYSIENVTYTAKTISLEYINKCEKDILVRLANACMYSGYKIEKRQTQSLSFIDITPKKFSNLLIVECDEKEYRVTIPGLKWEGREVGKVLNNIPLDPIDSVKKLIAPLREIGVKGVKNIYDTKDNAYERLLKHYLYNGEWQREMYSVKDKIDVRRREYNEILEHYYAQSKQEGHYPTREEFCDSMVNEQEEDEDNNLDKYAQLENTHKFLEDMYKLEAILEEFLRRRKNR